MDRRFLNRYNDELRHLRQNAGDFAEEFPKIAGRLALDRFDCADPYVERLLEGFAFLTARVQRKMDAEFPHLTQSLLETIYPHYLAPTPSMAIVQFDADPRDGSLAEGVTLERETVLRSRAGAGDTACEYRTTSEVTLYPLEISSAGYLMRELATFDLPANRAKAGLHLRLHCPEVGFDRVRPDRLRFYIRGINELPVQIYEQLFTRLQQVVVQPLKPDGRRTVLPASAVCQVGFEQEDAVLPTEARSFSGYRLLKEYFCMPQKFLFFDVVGLGEAWADWEEKEIDLLFLLGEEDLGLEGRVEKVNFLLGCTPAINLFPKRADRIALSDREHSWLVMPDRTKPLDYEVYQVQEVTGLGVRSQDRQPFTPFYAASDFNADVDDGGGYFVVHRVPRLPTNVERVHGRRSSYPGTEVYLSLVDSRNAPYNSDLRQLSLKILCTNRDLPLQVPVGKGDNDFDIDTTVAARSIRCVHGPTPPRPSYAEGETAWRLISHLSLNYLSLVEGGGKGAAAIREMLKLYGDPRDLEVRKQIEGLSAVDSQPVIRRVPGRGPISFVRGMEVEIELDEEGFEGTGVFTFGAVLDRFFAKHTTINSFTETVVKTKQRGTIKRWPVRMGMRHLL